MKVEKNKYWDWKSETIVDYSSTYPTTIKKWGLANTRREKILELLKEEKDESLGNIRSAS